MYPLDLGMASPWILWVVFQKLGRDMAIYLRYLKSLARCAFLCLVKKPSKDKKKQTCSLNRSRCTLAYQGVSSQIGIPYFTIPFGIHFGIIWTPNSRDIQLSIHRQMGRKK
jgi:hypothetical protein